MTMTHKKQKGFTLIELLVAMSIFATFIVITGADLFQVLQLQQRANVLRKTQQDTRQTLESIVREARNANGVFTADPKEGGQRNGRPYVGYLRGTSRAIECLGSAGIDPDSDILEIYRSDFANKKIVKKVFYVTNAAGVKVLQMAQCQKDIGSTNVFSPIPNTAAVALSDPGRVKITNFSTVVTPDNTAALTLPPKLEIILATESGRGAQAARPEDRASVTLKTLVTPRSY